MDIHLRLDIEGLLIPLKLQVLSLWSLGIVHIHSMWIPGVLHVYSMWTPCGLLPGFVVDNVEFLWTPCGVLVESKWTFAGLCGVDVESLWSLGGVFKDFVESTWSPQKHVQECKIQASCGH